MWLCLFVLLFFFFFKQKTAYELRISDWSSDVCSSDLNLFNQLIGGSVPVGQKGSLAACQRAPGRARQHSDQASSAQRNGARNAFAAAAAPAPPALSSAVTRALPTTTPSAIGVKADALAASFTPNPTPTGRPDARG